MALKRLLLLLLGITGSLAAAGILYISAENARSVQPQPELSTKPTQTSITLPVGVPGTALVAQRLSAYDGPFLEDSSDWEVFGIAALLVYNGGSKELQSARIELTFPDGVYTFAGDHIPPDSWVMLLEQNRKPYRQDSPIACAGSQTVSMENCEMIPQIQIEDTTYGMVVWNSGNEIIKDVCIYYKGWLSSPEIYLGGITYCTVIPKLQPGQRVQLQPYHYAPGYSKVVAIYGRK